MVRVSAGNWPGPMSEGQMAFPFPTERRIWRRQIDWEIPLSDVKAWFEVTGIRLGPLVPEGLREEIMRTFFAYRDLNAVALSDIPPTDLYLHQPRLKDGLRPWNRSPRRRWTDPERYWLNKLVGEGIETGMYEYTMSANHGLSDWSAEPVLVVKDLSDLWAERRLTFNYSYVGEDIPGTAIPLLAEIHDRLSDPRIGAYSQFDLKHAYWSIPVHPDGRHVFAFSIPGFAQLQPTRMPQGSQSAAFTMTEVMKLALGPIPSPLPEPSLLSPLVPGTVLPVDNYMDDVFLKHSDFTQ